MSARGWIGTAVCALAVSALLLGGCGKKSEEKMAEQMMEKTLKDTMGEEVDVNIQGKDITIEGKDTKARISETNVWPPDMFADVPRFTAGRIEHVTRSQAEGTRTFNIFFADMQGDALESYAAALKEKCWQAQLADLGKGGMISAQKDKMGLNLSFNAEDRKGTLAVFTAP
jgi:hypothetical protein